MPGRLILYKLIRRLLFSLPPEVAHQLALSALRIQPFRKKPLPWHGGPIDVMGLRFMNPLGLAAGLDKNGDYIDALGGLGFGFIEVGTVTPQPQSGNPRPRLFRLPEAEAIINRMGFNNKGLDHLLANVTRKSYSGILGINIGKNFTTPLERALDDYLVGLNQSYPVADYITVNISSPNTPGLRDLQKVESLHALLAPLKSRQKALATSTSRYVPLVVKVAPDLGDEEIEMMTDVFNQLAVDGVIATNTTSSRQGVEDLPHGMEAGGLSGRPVFKKTTSVLARFRKHLSDSITLIAAGGVFTADDMQKKLDAGADLVQVYTGLIYRGPQIVPALLLR